MIEKNKDFAPEFTENVSDEAVVSFGKSSGTRKQRKQKRQRKSPRRKWSVPLFFHMQQRPVWYLLY